MRKYEGERAKNYEAQRKGNSVYDWQQQAVEMILRHYLPKSIIDVPVGTGRFFEAYMQLGCQVLGIDVSQDMLDLAHEKGYDYPLLKADVFDLELWDEVDHKLFGGHMTVCTRFFGHLSDRKKARLLGLLKGLVILSHGPDAFVFFEKLNIKLIFTTRMPEKHIHVSLIHIR